MTSAQADSARVIPMSSALGCGLPLGWLCTKTNALAPIATNVMRPSYFEHAETFSSAPLNGSVLLAVSRKLARLPSCRALHASALTLTMLLGARSLRAEESPIVLLEIADCAAIDEAEVRRIVAAELGARPAEVAGSDVTKVRVSCKDTRVLIDVQDPLTRKRVHRSFDIGLSDPRSRARLLAIAATELVLASWAELDTNPKLRVEPEGPRAPEDVTRAARKIAAKRTIAIVPKARPGVRVEAPDERSFRIVALASRRSFFNYQGAMWGGGVRIGEDRFRFVSWSLDVLVEDGPLMSAVSTSRVTTGTLGGALLLYGTAGPLVGRVGVGLRAGVTAIPNNSASIVPWGWPLAASSVSVRLGRRFVLELSGEGGYTVLPVQRGETLNGAWFSAQAGLGLVLSGSEPNPRLTVEGEEE